MNEASSIFKMQIGLTLGILTSYPLGVPCSIHFYT